MLDLPTQHAQKGLLTQCNFLDQLGQIDVYYLGNKKEACLNEI